MNIILTINNKYVIPVYNDISQRVEMYVCSPSGERYLIHTIKYKDY